MHDNLPKWRCAQLSTVYLSPLEQNWLLADQSLTTRLLHLSKQQFSVAPLIERWQALRLDETTALGLAPDTEGWGREVFLYGEGTPWIFARSVAERSQLEQYAPSLTKLGNRSLGAVLFQDARFARSSFEVADYPSAWLPQAVSGLSCRARRSQFVSGALTVLVAEVFLPAFWQKVAAL